VFGNGIALRRLMFIVSIDIIQCIGFMFDKMTALHFRLAHTDFRIILLSPQYKIYYDVRYNNILTLVRITNYNVLLTNEFQYTL